MNPTTWQEVALQALNGAQTVLLAYLTVTVRQNGTQLQQIQDRGRNIRRSDRGPDGRRPEWAPAEDTDDGT